MFDFDKEEMMEETVTMTEFEWDEITGDHAEQEHDAGRDAEIFNQGKQEASNNFYEKRRRHRKEKIAIDSARFAFLAIGLSVIGYAVRSIPGLAITLAIVALVFGLISAYGAGMYKAM